MTLPVPELELQDANGTVFPLEFPRRHLMEMSGLGMPPIQHWSTRAPFQHGRSHWGYAFGPRVVNLVLYSGGCNRQSVYDARAANVAMLNPMNSPMKLRLTYPNGHTYELHDCWYNGGYELSSTEGGSRFQRGGVQLVAYDPFWKWATAPLDAGESRDANGRICVSDDTFTLATALVLPFTGPFLLGTTVATNTLAVTNDGSWAIKPVITITGPVEDWTLTNGANGDVLTWDGYAIAAGEVVTLDIPNKTCSNGAGDDLIAYVGGNFGTFALDPGLNTLTFWGSGGVVDGVTTVSVCWYVEVLGV